MSRDIVLTGGGTAGHIEPMLATAAALRRRAPDIGITCIGSAGGLETTLVPARGFDLKVVPAVPLPRKPTLDLAKLPPRVVKATLAARRILVDVQAVAVVGFGGYAALPAYLAARTRGVPVIVHEANVTPGLANKIGARWAKVVATAVPIAGLAGAQVVGMPIRDAISSIDRAALRDEAIAHFGLRPGFTTLLVYGGSQGARTLNNAIGGAADALHDAGIQVLHSYGKKNEVVPPRYADGPAYVALPYIDQMHFAYAAADFVLCRSGMGTVAEVSAVGLPACYVPLPHGNGEQRKNAQPIVERGGGLLIEDERMTPEVLVGELLPILSDSAKIADMSAKATGAGHRDAADRLAGLILEVAHT